MDNKEFLSVRNEFFRTLLFLAVIAGGLIYLFGPKSAKKIQLTCDAEQVEHRAGESFFYSSGGLLRGAHRSKDAARSGAYSLELFSENPYGFQWEMDQLEGSEYVEIEVWRKNFRQGFKEGKLVAEVQGILWEAAKEAPADGNAEWVKLTLAFSLDCRSEKGMLKIYCWNPSEHKVYFDDLSINVIGK